MLGWSRVSQSSVVLKPEIILWCICFPVLSYFLWEKDLKREISQWSGFWPCMNYSTNIYFTSHFVFWALLHQTQTQHCTLNSHAVFPDINVKRKRHGTYFKFLPQRRVTQMNLYVSWSSGWFCVCVCVLVSAGRDSLHLKVLPCLLLLIPCK